MSHETSGGTQTGFVSGLNEAIRENPLAAGLIGAGLCWMLFGKVKAPALGSVADAVKGAAGAVGGAASAGGSTIASAANKAGSQVVETATHVADRARDAVSNLVPGQTPSIVPEAGEMLSAGLRASGQAARRYGTTAQQTLSESLERQPLLLGAIGLAIGAGIASAFASTQFESELMGEQGSAAREKLQDFAEETKEFATTRAHDVLDAMKDEAQAQGLTPEAAKDAFQNLQRKAKGVAESAREAVRTRTS
jgi:hypothetical protein